MAIEGPDGEALAPLPAVPAIADPVLRLGSGELIAPDQCPDCKRPRDQKRRCWHCHNRACENCGRPTSSAFLARCITCDMGDRR